MLIPIAKVRDVVKSPLITVDGYLSVLEAARLMTEKNISGLVVLINGRQRVC